MKHSAAILSAAAVASAVSPSFLNNDYPVAIGEPFTLLFSGCETSCTITLENGPTDDLQPVEVLTGELPRAQCAHDALRPKMRFD